MKRILLFVCATSCALAQPPLVTITPIGPLVSGNGTVTGNVTVASGKTFTVNNTLTLSGTDGSTLNVSGGGTLGTGAFQPQTVLTGTANQIAVSNSGVGATTVSIATNPTLPGNSILTGSLTTSNPASGTAAAFKVGSFIAGQPSGTAGYIQFDSAGAAYQIPVGPVATPAFGRVTAQTGAVATIKQVTVGSSDSSYVISANVNVTTATAHSFTCTCIYTDETNVSRTITLGFMQVGGVTIVGTITNVTGSGPYEGVPVHIRAKASTTITIGTTGTFTTVTYNAEGCIDQIN